MLESPRAAWASFYSNSTERTCAMQLLQVTECAGRAGLPGKSPHLFHSRNPPTHGLASGRNCFRDSGVFP
jgi:hypothetical protein